jgi:hypothetical protein
MSNVAREVWFSEEAYISIYQENGDGTYNPTPTHSFKFVQNVSIKKSMELIVAGQPGAADNDIYSIPGVFDCSIGEYFWTKAEQWTPFLDSQKRWRVAFSNVNAYYDGVTQVNDSIVLRNAAIAAPSLSWKVNDMQASALDFRAESVE